ncbi:MAG: hypothetical protein WCB71_13560, partial [Aestuariivirga sp.]
AAHGSGNFETLSTLSPPFRNHQKMIYSYNRNESRGLGINIFRLGKELSSRAKNKKPGYAPGLLGFQ